MKALWTRRRQKAGTIEKRYELMMAGKYHNGISPRDSLRVAKAAQQDQSRSPQTLQGRVRKALARVCYSYKGQFVECLGCRKLLYRPNSILRRGQTHWHNPCWRRSLIGNPKGYRPPRKSGVSKEYRVEATLLHDGLQKLLGDLGQRFRGKSDEDGQKVISKAIKRGRRDLDGLLWGELFPGKEKKAWHIHKVLKDFPVREVLEIAAGTHPLSRVSDVESVKQWFPTSREVNPLEGYEVADNELSHLLATAIIDRFDSVAAAATTVGISHRTLTGMIWNKWSTYSWKTWAAISALTETPETELRDLHKTSISSSSAEDAIASPT